MPPTTRGLEEEKPQGELGSALEWLLKNSE